MLETGQKYLSLPVSIGVADYNEYCALTADQFAWFLRSPEAAHPFLEECRRHEHEDLLLQKPG